MNHLLEEFAHKICLSSPERERLRLSFGYACAKRVEHLLEESEVAECLSVLGKYLAGSASKMTLLSVQKCAEELANRHSGSRSIDGCGHAAVSASYAVANAVNGKALQSASYAAYAAIYAVGGYEAVAQREAFDDEYCWQLKTLETLASEFIVS